MISVMHRLLMFQRDRQQERRMRGEGVRGSGLTDPSVDDNTMCMQYLNNCVNAEQELHANRQLKGPGQIGKPRIISAHLALSDTDHLAPIKSLRISLLASSELFHTYLALAGMCYYYAYAV